jgi:hypothetical protein
MASIESLVDRKPSWYMSSSGLRGTCDAHIHWAQESFDQGSLVRDFVKWDYELRNFSQVETVVDRALEIAMAEPRGLVYLTLPREVLAEEHTEFSYTSPSRHTTESPPYPAPKRIKEAAQALASAKSPLIVTQRVGVHPKHGKILGGVGGELRDPSGEPGRDVHELPKQSPPDIWDTSLNRLCRKLMSFWSSMPMFPGSRPWRNCKTQPP